MELEPKLSEIQKEWHGTYKAYAIGFIASLILTFASYFLALLHLEWVVKMVVLGALALVQAIVQLIYFLHIGTESKPKWETLIFCFMVMVLFILVLGTLWIMYDLEQRTMTMGSM